MRLIQIPFSHNCVKVRRALALKGLAYTTLDIHPLRREPVILVSGQSQVPVLEDGGRVVSESTAILLYLEEAYPHPPLLPGDPTLRARCLVLEDWADRAFMALSRRLAYWNLVRTAGAVGDLFFPHARGLRRSVQGRVAARVVAKRFGLSPRRYAVDRLEAPRLATLAMNILEGRETLLGDGITIADVALAAMAAPLGAAPAEVRNDPAVGALLAWSAGILGEEASGLYRAPDSEDS